MGFVDSSGSKVNGFSTEMEDAMQKMVGKIDQGGRRWGGGGDGGGHFLSLLVASSSMVTITHHRTAPANVCRVVVVGGVHGVRETRI